MFRYPQRLKPQFKAALYGTTEVVPFQALSLALFVFRVDADHPHHAFAVDDLALVANFLN
jgi:hypothetical protein